MTRSQIFVCNCGSSSVKVDVFSINNAGERLVASAAAERIGSDNVRVRFKLPMERELNPGRLDHGAALRLIAEELMTEGVFRPEERLGVGHRVVHGAEHITAPVLVTDQVIAVIEECAGLAPLHNPPNLAGIRAAVDLFGGPQVAVFDTSFHATMEAAAFTYALPRELTAKYRLRRYGFHGPSHEFVGREAAHRLGHDFGALRLITLHLGNGASACAIRHGRSIETSMGFTPLEGLVMGTRTGDLDPAVPAFLMEREGFGTGELDRILNKESGLKGICGYNDMRDLVSRASAGDEACVLARDVFCRRIKKYVGAYVALLGGADAIVFTAGIGENSPEIRALSLAGLEGLGIEMDQERNEAVPPNGIVSVDGARTAVLVIPTDEELMIARETARLLA